jgi:hypothetical protein
MDIPSSWQHIGCRTAHGSSVTGLPEQHMSLLCPPLLPQAARPLQSTLPAIAADAEDFASGPLSAGVPFRGFATAGDDAVVGTPSPFGSAMSQHMADRHASSPSMADQHA